MVGFVRHLESAEQKAVFQWAATQYRKHPELRLMYAIPNGGFRNVREASRLKAEGVKAGVPDIHLPVANRPHIGLFIEMKRKGAKPRANQIEWLTGLAKLGHKCAVCFDWVEAAEVIRGYLK